MRCTVILPTTGRCNADIDFNKAPDSFRRVPLIKLKARADIYLEDFENTLSAVAQDSQSEAC